MTAVRQSCCGFTRGLRFRLAFSYVFFFTILLVLLGNVFRQTLSATFQSQMESVLDEEWGAAKGYLRTGPEGPNWFYDDKDPDESFAVAPLAASLHAGRHGRPPAAALRNLRFAGHRSSVARFKPSCSRASRPSASAPTASGVPYMIRSGLMGGSGRPQILSGDRPGARLQRQGDRRFHLELFRAGAAS